MALQKTMPLPNGTQGAYIKLKFFRWDDIEREASAHFYLYASKAAREGSPGEPVKETAIAVLRLNGPKFDQWVSNKAVANAKSTIVGQFYAALKVEEAKAGGGLTSIDLSDATDV